MLATILLALVLLCASAVLGQAVLALCGLEEWRPWSPAVGFSVLLALGAQMVWVPGRAITVAVVALLLVAGALVLRPARTALRGAGGDALWVGLGTLVLALLPFIAAGHAGVLGANIQNDMSAHLLGAYWMGTHNGPPPVGALGAPILAVGYPVGPHGLAELLARPLGLSEEITFGAVTVVVAPLAALATLQFVRDLPVVGRVVVGPAVALAYLSAAYLAQGSFKETTEAMILVATVAGLADVAREARPPARRGVALGVLIAGGAYVYSFPGLGWPLGAAGVLLVVEVLRRPRRAIALSRAAAPATGAAVLATVVVCAPDIGRMISFASSPFAAEAQLRKGNLFGALPPREGLPVWLSNDFRLPPTAPSLTTLGTFLSLAALAGGVVWWWRRRTLAPVAGLLAAVVLYVDLKVTKNVYDAAKGLAVVAPIAALVIAAPLLAAWRARPRRRVLRGLVAGVRLGGVVLLLVAAWSSFLVLRDTHVGLGPQVAELDRLRALLPKGERVLFLSLDDFAQWELRGTTFYTGPLLYSKRRATLSPAKRYVRGAPLDADNFTPAELDRYAAIVAPRSSFASAMPPNFRLEARTPQYVLWRRTGPTPPRTSLDPRNGTGRVLDCASPRGRRALASSRLAAVAPAPVVMPVPPWQGQATTAGRAGLLQLSLPPGRWDVSLQYLADTGLELEAPGLRAELPAIVNRAGPYWPAGVINNRGGSLTLTARARDPLPGRFLGRQTRNRMLLARGDLPLAGIAFTRHGARPRLVPVREACGKWVDYLVPRTA